MELSLTYDWAEWSQRGLYLPAVVLTISTVLLVQSVYRKHFESFTNKPGQDLVKNSGLLDYFRLSKVHPPKSLPDLDIDNAKPRPYRKFCWEYHQAMCRSSHRQVVSCWVVTWRTSSIKENGARLVDRAGVDLSRTARPERGKSAISVLPGTGLAAMVRHPAYMYASSESVSLWPKDRNVPQ